MSKRKRESKEGQGKKKHDDIEDLDDVDEPTIALHDLGGVQHAPTEPEEEKEDLEHTRAFQMPKDPGLDIEDL